MVNSSKLLIKIITSNTSYPSYAAVNQAQ